MCIYNLDKSSRRRVLYHATLEHFRSGQGLDYTARQRIEESGRIIPDTDLLRDIAKEYKVIRGIPKPDEFGDDSAAISLVREINKIKNNWPNKMTDKAEKCLSFCEEAKTQGWTRKKQISAVTKFMWFLCPEGWTVYDRFARRGLCIYKDDQKLAVRKFYGTLETRGFVETASNITQTIRGEDQSLGWLYGERVIDKYLMIAGGAVESNLIKSVQTIKGMLQAEDAKNAHALAEAVADQHWDDPFFLPPQD